MKIPIVYGTTEGQTHKIAERIAAHIGEHGLSAGQIRASTLANI